MSLNNSTQQALTWNQPLSKSEYRQRRLTFGRYTNTQIQHLPQDYLEWGILNLPDVWADYFSREWQARLKSKK